MSTIPTSAVSVFGRRSNSDRGWGRHPNEPTSKGRVSGRSRVIAPPPRNDEPRINDRIRAREVRLIGQDGAQLGMKTLPEALSIARAAELDLVEVAGNANPPVCRIMDYGKYKFEAQQRAKESRKKATNITVKEMKYRPKIGGGDFDTKTRKVEQFLGEGHKVKITIMFRGREMQHPELGRKILDQVAEKVADVGRVEVFPKQDGRNMTMVLGPDKKAQAAAQKRAAAEAAEAAATADDAAETEIPLDADGAGSEEATKES
ncbi:MAG: translation initiation factor IF-3 [Microthrixaceae bacterium]|nr:translation initiation factor IF-3 [Microthrixaceae bacterium]